MRPSRPVQVPRNGAGLAPLRGGHVGDFTWCLLWGQAQQTAAPDAEKPASSLNCRGPLQKPPALSLPPPGPSSYLSFIRSPLPRHLPLRQVQLSGPTGPASSALWWGAWTGGQVRQEVCCAVLLKAAGSEGGLGGQPQFTLLLRGCNWVLSLRRAQGGVDSRPYTSQHQDCANQLAREQQALGPSCPGTAGGRSKSFLWPVPRSAPPPSGLASFTHLQSLLLTPSAG